MSFLEDIRKQPKHVREIMFGLCVVTAVSIVGMIWFRSFEEKIFVLVNPEPEKQEKFYAERNSRTPTALAGVTEALGNMRAAFYSALGFFEEYNSQQVDVPEEEYKGETHSLPLSGDK